MTPADMDRLWREAQVKTRALKVCDAHDFEDLDPKKTIGKRWRCRVCGGEIGSLERGMYLQGVEHGRKAAAT